jgi:hypothetical protein
MNLEKLVDLWAFDCKKAMIIIRMKLNMAKDLEHFEDSAAPNVLHNFRIEKLMSEKFFAKFYSNNFFSIIWTSIINIYYRELIHLSFTGSCCMNRYFKSNHFLKALFSRVSASENNLFSVYDIHLFPFALSYYSLFSTQIVRLSLT